MATRLLGPDGAPLDRSALKAEISRPRFGAVRSPTTGYPADGLTPGALGAILREADAGYPVRYLELLQFMEERDPHYAGVMATRRRSVAQLPLGVEAFSDDPAHEAEADEVRGWLKRRFIQQALFDILDCLPKGFSFSEIVWGDVGAGWRPMRILRRDPRWFRFDRADLETPLMLSDMGGEVPLPYGKFIFARIGANSGLPLRSGIGRIALWSYLFKMYTQRDWQIFLQTYGQPLRVGKYGAGASEADKETLFQAVSNIAGDCAAIIPESMMIEFVEAGALSATGELYERRSDWNDKQVSKLILGQTATTDALTGGMGSGKEHRQVQEDIERADAAALAAILTEQLIHPWARLNGRDPEEAPSFTLERPEEEDLEQFGRALAPFIDRGLKVPVKAVRDKFGLPEPDADEEVLQPVRGGSSGQVPAPDDDPDAPEGDAPAPASKFKRVSGVFKRGEAPAGPVTALSATGPLAATPRSRAPEAVLGDRMAREAAPAMEAMIARIEAMVEAAGSLEELRAMFATAFPDLPVEALGDVLGLGLVAAAAGGRLAVEDESGAAS
jgi:phage gp29-like protein